nr:hypothetical protein [Tanacetum cinerariifolium]
KDKEVPTSEGSLVTRTERVNGTYKNVSQDIRYQLNAKVEAVQIILTGIDNDIYSTVDACLNAKGMSEAEKGKGCSLSQGEDAIELEAHYMYMAQLQEVSPDAVDFGPIFDDEPLQKVSNDNHYNVFAMESTHHEQSKTMHDTYPIEQDAQNVLIDSLDMNYDREEINQNDDDNDLSKERELLASLIKKLKCEIDESKNRNKFFGNIKKGFN